MVTGWTQAASETNLSPYPELHICKSGLVCAAFHTVAVEFLTETCLVNAYSVSQEIANKKCISQNFEKSRQKPNKRLGRFYVIC